MDNKKIPKGAGLFGAVREMGAKEAERRRNEKSAFLYDVAVVAISFFFARRHFVFGSYPLASAFIAVLPSRVLPALLGSAIGALTLGRSGVIFAINSLIIVFLRIILSGGSDSGEGEAAGLFREPYVMRVFSASVGAALSGVYNVLTSGISLSSVFSGVFGVLFSAALSLALYGLFSYGITADDILFGSRNIFSERLSDSERWARASFYVGALAFLYLVGFSLAEYSFFGIDAVYIFATGVTLFAAKRFGAARAIAVGFAAALGASPTLAVAVALSGVGSGLLFGVGYGYAVLGGGALLFLWASYTGGMMEVLSILPEYSVSALIFYPFLKGARAERGGEESLAVSEDALEMVETMAAMKNSSDEEIREVENSLILAAGAIKNYGREDLRGEFEDYRNLVIAVTSLFVPDPCEENIDTLATKLYKRERVGAEDIERLFPTASSYPELCEELYRLVSEYEQNSGERRRMDAVAREYELISKMINDARVRRSEGAVCDNGMSERLAPVFAKGGFADGVIRVYGTRRKRIIGAGADSDGKLITSPELKRALEEESGLLLDKFEFYRKGEIALFEAVSRPLWQVEYATVSDSPDRSEVSGDTAAFFEYDSVFYSLISDGMGSGRTAERTSRFVSEFLSNILTSKENLISSLRAANHLIRHRGEECSATVDLFSLDLLTGEAAFTKCGAAPSFLKREGSLFRIKSATAPIGLMKDVDSEEIRVEIKDGDYIVMISDGVYLLPDDAVWLFEFLSRPAPESAQEFAEAILKAAKRSSDIDDDITVSVIRIYKC